MVVSGKIDEVQARVMGDAVLAVEVLGPAEAFLGSSAPTTARRGGRAEGRRRPIEFRYGGDAEAACDLLAALVGAGVRVVVVRPEAGRARGAVPQGRRQGALVMDASPLAIVLDNPLLTKHLRSQLRPRRRDPGPVDRRARGGVARRPGQAGGGSTGPPVP